MIRYAFGGALCLLAGINVLIGSPGYVGLGIAVAGIGIICGSGRRIFGAGVSRSEDEIVCRYVPWREGNAFLLNVLLPLLAAATVVAGYAPGNPTWLRFIGIILLCISAFFLVSNLSMWRRSFLCVAASALRVHGADGARDWTDISRDRVQSIEPKLVTVGTESLQVAILYRTADEGCEQTNTVLLGPRLTVQPINLLNALVAWKDGTSGDPSELLDRFDRTLRGRSTVGK